MFFPRNRNGSSIIIQLFDILKEAVIAVIKYLVGSKLGDSDMPQTVDSKMIMLYATICGYSFSMTVNAFKLNLFQIIIEKRKFNKNGEKGDYLFTFPLRGPLKTQGGVPLVELVNCRDA